MLFRSVSRLGLRVYRPSWITPRCASVSGKCGGQGESDCTNIHLRSEGRLGCDEPSRRVRRSIIPTPPLQEMSVASLKIYRPCINPYSLPPPQNLPSSSYSYHEIHDLYFCEECDSIRCNRCVSVEVSGYYCPNCLFEVPSASVRGVQANDSGFGFLS